MIVGCLIRDLLVAEDTSSTFEFIDMGHFARNSYTTGLAKIAERELLQAAIESITGGGLVFAARRGLDEVLKVTGERVKVSDSRETPECEVCSGLPFFSSNVSRLFCLCRIA